MPSTMTHTYFCLDVYKKLPTKYKNKITNIEYLKLFAQGTDPLMFYNYLIGKKAKYFKNIQYLTHTTKTRDYFLNLINYINDNNLENNSEIISYLYGNICHYFLDLEIHPYIFYKTGIFNKSHKYSYKYNGLHQEMEYTIDQYFIHQKETVSPNKFKIHDNIFKYYPLSQELIKTINYTIYKTYNIDNITVAYIKSIKNMKKFFKYFNYDKIGIKKIIYSLIDIITPKSIINLKELSYNNNYQKKLHYLNFDKSKWHHPCNKNEVYNYSLIELYEKATSNTQKAIIEVTKMLDSKKINTTKLKQIFNNSSYITGKNCNNKYEIKYFEF